jgi:two-component system, OmpR family, sensor histidine kinase MprB
MIDRLRRLGSGFRVVGRRWRGAPLRTRLTAAAALSATLAIFAVVAVAYVAVRHELLADLDNQLHHQKTEVHVERSSALPIENGVPTAIVPTVQISTQFGEGVGYLQSVNEDGARSATSPQLPVSASDVNIAHYGGSKLRDAYVNGVHVRMLTFSFQMPPQYQVPADDSRLAVQLALPLTAVDHQLHKVAIALLILVLAGLALATTGTWLVVRRTMRPVATLTDAAEQIAETRDLTTRIEDYGSDELGRLASTFNLMLDALERSLNQQRQLILDASHELRTPLASLRTNVEVLNDVDRLTVPQRESLLEGIVTQLDELTGLVADVVELARGEAPEGAQENIAFDDLVAHAVDRARRHWPNLVFKLDAHPATVRGVPARLDRAVANLLDNAGKFSPPGAVVDVVITSRGVLTVADHGPGIPEDALGQVFDRFYRADEARAMPGSGLGLSIVKQVVDGHGGTVVLTNRATGGALVRMVLPVVGGADGGAEQPASSVGAVEPVG